MKGEARSVKGPVKEWLAPFSCGGCILNAGTDKHRPDHYTRPVRNRLAIALVIIALGIGLAIAATLAWLVVRRATPGPKIGNTATIIQQIQSLSELVTVKYVVEKVVI